MKPSDFPVGMRVECNEMRYPATVIFNKERHGIGPYEGWVLVQIDEGNGIGWTGGGHLTPKHHPELEGLHHLLWVSPSRMWPLQTPLDFEMDA